MKQQALYKITGMQKDVADSSADKQHAFNLHNMRLRHSDTNTLTALINEEGSVIARDAEGNPVNILGTVIGFNTINDEAVLFTHEEDNVQYITDDISQTPTRLTAPNHPLDAVFCTADIVAFGHMRSHLSSNITVNGVSSWTDEDFIISITRFDVDYDKLTDDPDEVVAEIMLNSDSYLDGSFSLISPNGQTMQSRMLSVTRSVAYSVSSSMPYVFRVKYHRNSGIDRTEPLLFSCNVSISETVPINSTAYDQPQELRVVSIDFNVTVPAIDGSTPTPHDPDVVPEPELFNGITFDLSEELSTKQCDHIYILKTRKRTSNDANVGICNDVVVSVFEYFRGDLGFSAEHPIESTVYFENEEIKKIYWVDGIHQMRYANIADRNKVTLIDTDTAAQSVVDVAWQDNLMFDSVPLLHLQEQVSVTRNSTGGVFPSGTVQWAFTYMKRYGAESNIAWMSPIHYSSPDDRGGAPGEICANSFTLTITSYEPNTRFDYIRLYHIIHTTLDGEAEVRRVADIPIPDPVGDDQCPPIVYTDSNTTGEAVDPNELLYLGGTSVYPNTIEQKSNTLFLGNLKQQFNYLQDVLNDVGYTFGRQIQDNFEFTLTPTDVPADRFSGYYSHENQLKSDSYNITSFRRGEEYRFGFQAQDTTGKWSDVWWIGDYTNTDKYPTFKSANGNPSCLHTVHAKFTIDSAIVNKLRDEGYRRVRPVVVYPQSYERNIYTSGILNPTVYNVKDRASNAPFAQSSWFIRPFSPIDLRSITIPGHDSFTGFSSSNNDGFGNFIWDSTDNYTIPVFEMPVFYEHGALSPLAVDGYRFLSANNGVLFYDKSNFGSWAEFRHNHPLGDSQQRNGEIPTMYNHRPDFESESATSSYTLTFPYTGNDEGDRRDFIGDAPDFFYVDQSILTMNSADIDFDNSLQATKLNGCSLRVTGIVPINSFISSYDILTKTPPNKFYTDDNNGMTIAPGLYTSETIGARMTDIGHGWKSLISAPLWFDDVAWHSIKGDDYPDNTACTPIGFAIYPWQGQGSLNNDTVGSRREYPEDGSDAEESKSNTGDNYISAELKTKVISNLHYSWRTCPVTDISLVNSIGVQASVVLNDQQVSLINLAEPTNSSLGTLHYFGNIDKLITPISGFIIENPGNNAVPNAYKYHLTRFGGYPKMVSSLPYSNRYCNDVEPNRLAFASPYTPIGYINQINGSSVSGYHGGLSGYYADAISGAAPLENGSDRSMSSVPIKYKSGNHVVLALDYTTSGNGNIQTILDWLPERSNIITSDYPFWENGAARFKSFSLAKPDVSFAELFDANDVQISQHTETNGLSFQYTRFFSSMVFDDYAPYMAGYLYLGELYHAPAENKFGGTTYEAMEQNMWLPAGRPVYLAANSQTEIEWSAGDTYYQRYDALRIYPFTEEDMNKVIDIVSFMTETHINIDGRYDKNRGLSNNNYARPQNFNLINHVYSQQDNFFTYHVVNPKKVHMDVFEYSFTWSMTKVAGALRDEWTRISLASAYDCDGNRGSLNRIVRLDNQLVSFQDNGVAQILFNENVQLQGSEGTPIELANSGKLQGLRYYTTEVGCQNKWSVAVQPNGIYWVDGKTRGMYMLGSDGIQPLSAIKGMATWFKNQNDLSTVWHPGDWRGFFSHTDKATGEIFLTGEDTCLCYDTLLGEFTGFYDYQQTSALITVGNTVLSIAEDMSIPDSMKEFGDMTANYDRIWLHRKDIENHCVIYNKPRPASVEFVCNSNNQGNDYGTDKVFDNLEWRADAWKYLGDDAWQYKPFVTFDSMYGHDHYQRFSTELNAVNGNSGNNEAPQMDYPPKPVNLRKKFKIWHTTMPRACELKHDDWVQTRDRIRDTWCHITLELTPELSHYRHILHDIIVTYFI